MPLGATGKEDPAFPALVIACYFSLFLYISQKLKKLNKPDGSAWDLGIEARPAAISRGATGPRTGSYWIPVGRPGASVLLEDQGARMVLSMSALFSSLQAEPL